MILTEEERGPQERVGVLTKMSQLISGMSRIQYRLPHSNTPVLAAS